MQTPTAHDANGQPVATTLTVDGDTVTMHVDHQGEGHAYPIVADPWVKVNDYRWVTHCCQNVYTWQPRSHQLWVFHYIGSYFGTWLIHNYPRYFWGYGNDSRSLWNVYFEGRWLLVHNEPWSGVFIPALITVQDPPVKVLTGRIPYSTYEYVGSHQEFRFDASKDCIVGVVMVAECYSTAADVDDNGVARASSAGTPTMAPQSIRQLEPILHILPGDPFIPMDFMNVFNCPFESKRTTMSYKSKCDPVTGHGGRPAQRVQRRGLRPEVPRAAGHGQDGHDGQRRLRHHDPRYADRRQSEQHRELAATQGLFQLGAAGHWRVRRPVLVLLRLQLLRHAARHHRQAPGGLESIVLKLDSRGVPQSARLSAHNSSTRVLSWAQITANTLNIDGHQYAGGNQGDLLPTTYNKHIRAWVGVGDHATLPACGGGFNTDAPGLHDRSCDNNQMFSTLYFTSPLTTMQRIDPNPQSVWCWSGVAGDGGGPTCRCPTSSSSASSAGIGSRPLACR